MGIIALGLFIAVTVILNTLAKRDIAESLLIALVCIAFLGGTQGPSMFWQAIRDASQSEVTFAGMAFVFMGIIVQATGLVDRLIEILNSEFDIRKSAWWSCICFNPELRVNRINGWIYRWQLGDCWICNNPVDEEIGMV